MASPYAADMRGVLKGYSEKLYKEKQYTLNAATEIEGFLFAGKDAEQRYHETGKFEFISTGGYYHSLPLDPLRQFIDTAAEVQRAMGFQNEKDHPEVAPSQFEINYGYAEVVAAADQIQLYKLLTRQIANNMGYTASFLPKPVVGVNGSGMHTNVSVSKGKTNLFWDEKGVEQLSKFGWDFLDRILTHALDLCLIFNSSVNAYRRLDPHFEAPNQIRASAVDRGAMVRVPIGNHRSMRTEVRAVAPDANPYLALYRSSRPVSTGRFRADNLRAGGRYLPDNIQQAIEDFKASQWIGEILGTDVQGRYARPEAGGCESFAARAGSDCEGLRGAVPPRGVQPIAVESILAQGWKQRGAAQKAAPFFFGERRRLRSDVGQEVGLDGTHQRFLIDDGLAALVAGGPADLIDQIAGMATAQFQLQ